MSDEYRMRFCFFFHSSLNSILHDEDEAQRFTIWPLQVGYHGKISKIIATML